MPKTVRTPSPTEELDWTLIRQGLQRCIASAAPKARVYDRWPLKFELGATAELLKSATDNGRIHAWIIGINRAVPTNDRSGGKLLLWDLTIRIWGLLGYEYGLDDDNTQNELENECRKVVQTIEANSIDLTLDDSRCLHEIGILKFDDIDTKGFGNDTIIVAEGELEMTIKEAL